MQFSIFEKIFFLSLVNLQAHQEMILLASVTLEIVKQLLNVLVTAVMLS